MFMRVSKRPKTTYEAGLLNYIIQYLITTIFKDINMKKNEEILFMKFFTEEKHANLFVENGLLKLRQAKYFQKKIIHQKN